MLLPALAAAKEKARRTACMNNTKQIGLSSIMYRDESGDAYPFGHRCFGGGTGDGSVIDPYAWPLQMLQYMGGHKSTNQPAIYLCPSERRDPAGWAFEVHYQASRQLLSDTEEGPNPTPRTGGMLRKTSIYWMFLEKDPAAPCNIRPGGLGTILSSWNYPPGSLGYRRHNGGMMAVAADGHNEFLKTPPYRPGAPAPKNFLELGDCSKGINPSSSWATDNPHNGTRVKLYTRYSQGLNGEPMF